MVTKVAVLDTHNLFARKKIGFLELDAVLNETITLSNTITSSPIETGERITDHIYNEPLELSLDCIVSESDPLRAAEGQKRTTRMEAYETLRDIWQSKTPIDVVAGYEVYTNMLVSSISIPRTNTDGDSIRFTVNFSQATILESLFLKDKTGRVTLGRKQPKQAPVAVSTIAINTLERLPA
jgi:hypothetical protein